MKNIYKILAILLLVIFAVACTNEEQFDNVKNNYNNKTDIMQIDTMMYESITEELAFELNKYTYQYEIVEYKDEEMIKLLNDFDNLIKNNTITVHSYDIQQALFAMETYFNYALIHKQTSFDTFSYSERNFSFVIPLNINKTISANVLREAYINFIGYVLNEMGNAYLQYSDLYIQNITQSQITFGLRLPPFYYVSSSFSIRGMIMRIPTDYPTIPNGINSDWNYMYEGVVDQTIRYWSKKYVNDLYICMHTINSPLPSLGTIMYATYMGSVFYDSSVYQNGMNFVSNPTYAQGSLFSIVRATILAARYFALNPVNNPNNYTNIDVLPACHEVYKINKWVSKQGYISQMKFGISSSDIFHDYLVDLDIERDIFLN
jgi:hypothetical protein